MDANFDLGMEDLFIGSNEGPEEAVMNDIPEEELVEVKPKKPQKITPKVTKEKIEKRLEEDVKASLDISGKPDYETTVTLPSKGILYNGLIPSEISLRGMTTRDEKILYASQSGNVFQRILKNCIIQPKDLDQIGRASCRERV